MALVALAGAGRWLAERFELSRGGPGETLLPMEGLRGAAVVLVFGVHYATLVTPWLSRPWEHLLFDTVHAVGNAGVDLFFVLSGFLIYGHLIRRPQPFTRYLARRVQRIYPTFLVVFALYVVLALLMPARSKLPAGDELLPYLVANLLLLPGLLPIEPLITVAWSLSYEMFFYLVMPLLIGLLTLRRRDARGRAGLMSVLWLLSLLGFGLFGGPVRLCMFFAGVLLAEALPRVRGPGSAVGMLAGLAGLLLMGLPAPGPALQALRTAGMGLCFGVLCQAALAGQAPALARALCWRPLRWLGNMSYSYYLLHGLALHAFFLVIQRLVLPTGQSEVALWLLLPALVFTLVVSAPLFLAVERPFSLAVARRPARSAARHQPG